MMGTNQVVDVDQTALRDRLRVIDAGVNEAIRELDAGIDELEAKCAEKNIPPERLGEVIAALRNGVANLQGIARNSGSPAAIRTAARLADRVDSLEAGDYLGIESGGVTDHVRSALDGR